MKLEQKHLDSFNVLSDLALKNSGLGAVQHFDLLRNYFQTTVTEQGQEAQKPVEKKG